MTSLREVCEIVVEAAQAEVDAAPKRKSSVKAKKHRAERMTVGAAQDYLMWVGAEFYPTAESYIVEAEERGCCKRVGKTPTTLTPGQSRVFLAHDEGLTGDGFVFGYFTVDRVEILVDYLEDIEPWLEGRVTPVFRGDLQEEDRLCGNRDALGALYLVGPFTRLEPCRRLERFDPDRGHFRGAFRITYGDQLVSTELKADMMDPPSWKAVPRLTGRVPWTRSQLKALRKKWMKGTAEGKSIQRIAQEVTFQTGRSRQTVAYRIAEFIKADKRAAERARREAEEGPEDIPEISSESPPENA